MNKLNQKSQIVTGGASGSSTLKPLSYRLIAYMVLVLSAVLGQVSLLALGLFLYHGSFRLVNFGLGETGIFLVDISLCMAFFIQHSIMVRQRFRQWLSGYIREEFHLALYSIASGIVLLGIVVFWQESSLVSASSQGTSYWLLRGGYFLSIAGFAWGNLALGTFDSFGLNSILNHLREIKPGPRTFVVRGPYRWVRHPLYFCTLLMMWSCPYLSMDRLLFNILFTVWIVIGMKLEERDLLGSFGDAYQEYREKVPILIPIKIRPGM
jgi:protein-S-isoprenylcysteine O-methyltransferase Ste14